MLKSRERIGHGDIGDVRWDSILLAKSLELLPGEAMEIHWSKQAVLVFENERRLTESEGL